MHIAQSGTHKGQREAKEPGKEPARGPWSFPSPPETPFASRPAGPAAVSAPAKCELRVPYECLPTREPTSIIGERGCVVRAREAIPEQLRHKRMPRFREVQVGEGSINTRTMQKPNVTKCNVSSKESVQAPQNRGSGRTSTIGAVAVALDVVESFVFVSHGGLCAAGI